MNYVYLLHPDPGYIDLSLDAHRWEGRKVAVVMANGVAGQTKSEVLQKFYMHLKVQKWKTLSSNLDDALRDVHLHSTLCNRSIRISSHTVHMPIAGAKPLLVPSLFYSGAYFNFRRWLYPSRSGTFICIPSGVRRRLRDGYNIFCVGIYKVQT